MKNRIINIDHHMLRTSEMKYVVESTKTNAGTKKPKDRPMNIKVSEKISKKYFKGKDQKTIDDILEKALAAWFAAESGGADV